MDELARVLLSGGSMNAVRPSLQLLSLALIAATSLAACGPDYPNCRNDDQCHEHEYCVNRQCAQCRTNADCEGGQRCEAGACVGEAYECTGDADCGPGRACSNHRCITASSSTDTSTPATNDSDASTCGQSPIYFAYDASSLDRDARAALVEAARCIADERPAETRVTGMTDPRGTEEYNFTLGERRAHAVRDYLSRLGTPRASIRTTSVGEEYSEGSDEASWARDRRAVIEPR